jgi:hypothetical protein
MAMASIVYNPSTGELAVDVPGTKLTSINIDSAACIFTGDPAQNLGGDFDNHTDCNIFKTTFGTSFGSLSFGNVAQTGLSPFFIFNDLTVHGSLRGGGFLGAVELRDLRPLGWWRLKAGDANRDYAFDQFDIVQVQQAAKYLTGQPATWGEGDWDGGPDGYPWEPPVGNGLFDQQDIVAALQTGNYLQGPYAATVPEPSSVVLLVIAVGLVVGARRGRA